MKFHLEATPAELWQKGTALVEELADAFSGVNPDLAETLEKALPPKEQDLKYPVLQGLRDITTKEYDAMLKRMLAAIGKVLDQSVSGTSGGSTELSKAEKLTKQEGEEEEKLEPGDVDPETGELIPEEDEEDEEGEGEEEEKALEKGLLTEDELLKKIEKMRTDWAKVKADFDKHTHPVPSFRMDSGPRIVKAELPQSEPWQDLGSPRTEPLKYDFTKPIADKDERAYARVKRVLMGRGHTEADFEEGGQFYGYSVNELIDLVREARKVS